MTVNLITPVGSFSGIERVCLDGEIIPATGVRAEIVPAAIRYVPMK